MGDSIRDFPYYIRARLASDVESSEDELLVLAEDYEADIRLNVVKNPSSSSLVLGRFSDEREKRVISALIARDELPESVALNISSHLLDKLESLIAGGASEKEVIVDAFLCSNMVSHRVTPLSTMRKAGVHPSMMVRLSAASNPNLDSDTIYLMLIREDEVEVVEALLSHRNATEAVKRILLEVEANADELPYSYLRQIALISLPRLRKR